MVIIETISGAFGQTVLYYLPFLNGVFKVEFLNRATAARIVVPFNRKCILQPCKITFSLPKLALSPYDVPLLLTIFYLDSVSDFLRITAAETVGRSVGHCRRLRQH